LEGDDVVARYVEVDLQWFHRIFGTLAVSCPSIVSLLTWPNSECSALTSRSPTLDSNMAV
jgi:hypothetical protein